MNWSKERMMNELDYGGLLAHAGIEKGDTVDVASDLISIMMFCRKRKLSFSPDALIDALKELAGNDGTVMIRMFNWDFCHGEAYDVRKTPSRVGALGNTALLREDFRRTAHPLYSWMVWGKDAQKLCGMENRAAFGKGTPFDYLYEVHGKQLTIGNTVADACTQMHHCEALCAVPYRKEKDFTGDYTDENGETSRRTYSMYVRPLNLSVVNTNTNEGERRKILLEKGILRESFYDGALECSTILLHEITDFFCEDIRDHEGKFIVSVDGKEGCPAAGFDPLKLRF